MPLLILYAEDDSDDYILFLEFLKIVGIDVNCINAPNGIEALKFLDNSILLPDYIFLDVNMPAMDGKACLKAIKQDERFKDIPVIIYTTSRNPVDSEFCLANHADAYLSKPYSIEEARVTLEKVFHHPSQPLV
jgi:CheY-like chemotaxis protein